jgi:hypothetical protein
MWSPFVFARSFYSLCEPSVIVSVYTFIFDWKTSFEDIYNNTQKGVKFLVGIVLAWSKWKLLLER